MVEEVDEDGGGGVCGCASSAAVLVVVDARAGWRRPESGRGDKDLEERENGGDERWEEGPPAIGVASDPPSVAAYFMGRTLVLTVGLAFGRCLADIHDVEPLPPIPFAREAAPSFIAENESTLRSQPDRDCASPNRSGTSHSINDQPI